MDTQLAHATSESILCRERWDFLLFLIMLLFVVNKKFTKSFEVTMNRESQDIYSPFIHQKLVDIINKWEKTNDLNNLTTNCNYELFSSPLSNLYNQ